MKPYDYNLIDQQYADWIEAKWEAYIERQRTLSEPDESKGGESPRAYPPAASGSESVETA